MDWSDEDLDQPFQVREAAALSRAINQGSPRARRDAVRLLVVIVGIVLLVVVAIAVAALLG